MAKRKKKKKKSFLLTFIKMLATVLVIGTVVYVGWEYGKDIILDKAGESIMEYALKEKASEYGLKPEKVEEVMQKIDDTDKDVIEDIVEKHLDKETITETMEMVKNQDASGIKEMFDNKLSEEEKTKIKDLYEKYKDKFTEEEIEGMVEENQQ